MGNKKTISTIIACLMIPLLAIAAVKVEHLTKKDGLSGTIVSDLFQDRKGYIWIGTWEGLSRYDGYDFVNYTKKEASDINNFHNRVQKIYQDRFDNIWVMMYNDRLFRLNRLTESFEDIGDLTPEIGDSKMSRPLFTRGGDLWVQIEEKGLVRVITDSADNSMKAMFRPLENVKVNRLFEDSWGTVWLASEGDLKILSSDKIKTKSLADGEHPDVVVQCGNRVIWGTDDGRLVIYNYDTGKLEIAGVLKNEAISALSTSNDGRVLYIGTRLGNLYSYMIGNRTVRKIFSRPGPVDKLYNDSHGLVWAMTGEAGVVQYNPTANRVTHFTQTVSTPDEFPESRIVESDGELWVCMNKGGFGRYDRTTNTIDYFNHRPEDSKSLSNVVKRLLVTSGNEIWIATNRRGLDRITNIGSRVKEIKVPGRNGSVASGIKAFFTDRDSSVWIGTKTGDICIYDISGKLLHHIDKDPQGRPLGRVYDIVPDKSGEGNYWIGLREEGLMSMHLNSNGDYTMRRYRHSAADPYSISSDEIQDLLVDSKGRLWIATYGGGVNIAMPSEGGLIFYSAKNRLSGYPLKENGRVRGLAEDAEGNIWAATTDGLLRMTYDEKRHNVTTKVFRHRNEPGSIPGNDVICVYADPDHTIWLGSLGGGLSRYNGDGTFSTFNTDDGMPSNYVQALTSDDRGNIWLSTEENIVSFNKATHNFNVLNELDGISTAIFTERAAFFIPGGKVLFGSTEGCFVVDAVGLNKRPERGFNLQVTGVKIVKDGGHEGERRLVNYIMENNRIVLPEYDTELEVTVASLNYEEQRRVRYQWTLDNDTVWQNMQGRHVTLSTLSPGIHRLHVRAFPAGNPDSGDMISVEIEVPRPYWQKWWFWTILAVIFAATCAVLYVRWKRKHPAPDPEQSQNPLDDDVRKGKIVSIAPESILVEKDEDEMFMKHLLAWLEENYSDPEMKVETMVAASGLGRTSFYNKLKTLVNASPVDFVIDFRMKKARMLMRDTKKTISEIAYLTGYADPHYFTRAYKSRYNETPTQFRARLKKNDNSATENAETTDADN